MGLILMLNAGVARGDCVILLHGLARTSNSMNAIENELIQQGYYVANIGYPSILGSIEELAEDAIPRGIQQCQGLGKINFVSHSMGGILIRQYLSLHRIRKLDRVVMLAPPNQGSEIVDALAGFPGVEWVNLESGKQLGTGPDSLPGRLGRVNFDLGIIAGTRTTNPLTSKLLPDPDDGKVSVASTRVEGMNDHLVLPVSHSFMMRNHQVLKQITYYLKHGKFSR
ncbi:MAG: alpha/beta hydrolase [Gammaproteobacteria bacterium]|nr:alpha/beta hydrolase [Gammaproteobacteria bacterium]